MRLIFSSPASCEYGILRTKNRPSTAKPKIDKESRRTPYTFRKSSNKSNTRSIVLYTHYSGKVQVAEREITMDQSSMWVEYLDSSSLTFHRTLQSEDPITTTFFFIFGAVILFITCSLSRSSQREQREEEERREEERRQEVENAIKAAEKRRNKLISTFCSNDLIKVRLLIFEIDCN